MPTLNPGDIPQAGIDYWNANTKLDTANAGAAAAEAEAEARAQAQIALYKQQPGNAYSGAPAPTGTAFGAGAQGQPGYKPPAPAPSTGLEVTKPKPVGMMGGTAAPAASPTAGASFGGGAGAGVTAAPPPATGMMAGGAPGAASGLTVRGAHDALNWQGYGKDAEPTKALAQAMQANGWTPEYVDEQMGHQPGFTKTLLQQYGLSGPGGTQTTMQQNPNKTITDSPVDYRNETIEGRLSELLKQDANGNYLNPNVRQAVDRTNQQFNSRGLMNSSMAVQAGTEAAIAKAIEIAGPDAQTYFQNRRGNIDATNQVARDTIAFERDQAQKEDDRQFTTRQDYQKAQQAISSNFQRQLDTINASNMTPEDKSTAIAQATSQRDSEMVYQNNIYSRMPSWKNEWLSAATPTDGVNLASVSNLDMLENIINDPAQPEAMRNQARARRDALRGGAGAGEDSEDGGAGEYTGELPSSIDGKPAGWSTKPMGSSKTRKQLYDEYRANGGRASPSVWWRAQNGNEAGQGGPGNDSSSPSTGTGGDSSSATA